jgi:hypothetical protein
MQVNRRFMGHQADQIDLLRAEGAEAAEFTTEARRITETHGAAFVD